MYQQGYMYLGIYSSIITSPNYIITWCKNGFGEVLSIE